MRITLHYSAKRVLGILCQRIGFIQIDYSECGAESRLLAREVLDLLADDVYAALVRCVELKKITFDIITVKLVRNAKSRCRFSAARRAGEKAVRSEERRVGKECRSRWSP